MECISEPRNARDVIGLPGVVQVSVGYDCFYCDFDGDIRWQRIEWHFWTVLVLSVPGVYGNRSVEAEARGAQAALKSLDVTVTAQRSRAVISVS